MQLCKAAAILMLLCKTAAILMLLCKAAAILMLLRKAAAIPMLLYAVFQFRMVSMRIGIQHFRSMLIRSRIQDFDDQDRKKSTADIFLYQKLQVT